MGPEDFGTGVPGTAGSRSSFGGCSLAVGIGEPQTLKGGGRGTREVEVQPRPAGPFLSLCLWVSLSLSLSPSPSLLCLLLVSALPLPISSPPPTPGQPVGCPEAAVAAAAAAEWAPCSRPHPPLGVTPGQSLAACCLKGPAPRGKGEESDCLRFQAPPLPKMELMCMVGQEDTILRHPQIHVVRGVDPEACLPAWGRRQCMPGRAWV